MKTTKKNPISRELVMFAFMLFVVSYIIVDVYNYHYQTGINEAFLELHQLENNVTAAQTVIHVNTQMQIDRIVQILFQMSGAGID